MEMMAHHCSGWPTHIVLDIVRILFSPVRSLSYIILLATSQCLPFRSSVIYSHPPQGSHVIFSAIHHVTGILNLGI